MNNNIKKDDHSKKFVSKTSDGKWAISHEANSTPLLITKTQDEALTLVVSLTDVDQVFVKGKKGWEEYQITKEKIKRAKAAEKEFAKEIKTLERLQAKTDRSFDKLEDLHGLNEMKRLSINPRSSKVNFKDAEEQVRTNIRKENVWKRSKLQARQERIAEIEKKLIEIERDAQEKGIFTEGRTTRISDKQLALEKHRARLIKKNNKSSSFMYDVNETENTYEFNGTQLSSLNNSEELERNTFSSLSSVSPTSAALIGVTILLITLVLFGIIGWLF